MKTSDQTNNQNDIKNESVDVLFGGDEIFPNFLDLIDKAQKSIYLQIYEFHDDKIGHQVAKKLGEAAQRGCKVQVIYDYWGSILSSQSFFTQLKESGIEVKCYHSLFSKDVGKKFFKRNHRKTLVVDDSHAMLGGFNIGDEYVKDWKLGGIHDFSLLIENQCRVCEQIIKYFNQVWKRQKDILGPIDLMDKETRKKTRLFESQNKIKILGNHHLYQRWRIRRDFVHAFEHAKNSIWIINPYFIPDKKIIKSLYHALDRGLDVRLIVPERSDVSFVDAASKVILHKMIKKGVKVYSWPGFSHGKAICVDKKWLSLGSYNFDYRSLLHNLELVAHTRDETCVKKFVGFYEESIKHCTALDDQLWQNMRFFEKALSRLLYRFRIFL